MIRPILFVGLGMLTLSSCVSKKEFLAVQGSRDELAVQLERQKVNAEICERDRAALQSELANFQNSLRTRENELLTRSTELENERSKNSMLAQQLDYFKSNNANLLDRLADLSVVRSKSVV